MQIAPPAPSGATTPFATAPPRAKFTFEVVGIGAPHGHTVKKPGFDGSTAVTLAATAVASAGTVAAEPSVRRTAAPTIGTVMVAPGAMRSRGAPTALRVSTTRCGVVPTNAGVTVPPENQPAMSTRKWVVAFE